ncbi:hypothetical protein QR685DRAFT_126362 [Neurospora intermedia]|uniref:Secreted protein n=1 Tax=Neurospora intermedia TaxID=5142 RepID=A0ABR3CZC4_NEUIN
MLSQIVFFFSVSSWMMFIFMIINSSKCLNLSSLALHTHTKETYKWERKVYTKRWNIKRMRYRRHSHDKGRRKQVERR